MTAVRPPEGAEQLDGDEDLPPVPTLGAPRRPGSVRLAACACVLAAAVGFLVWRGLGQASVYFKTADEAVAQRRALGTHRFRIEGIVKHGTVAGADGALRFTIFGERGTEVPVVHSGGQPELFKDDIPVVLEGHFEPGSDVFASDRIIVKHSESYRAANPERVAGYGGK